MKILLYILLYFIAIIPFPFVYLFSELISFFVNKIFKYRKSVILENLKTSFPKKSEKEINNIKNKFYRHYSKVLIETIKLLVVGKRTLDRKIKFENDKAFKYLLNEKKGAIILSGHLGNFEMGGQHFVTQLKLPIYTSYKKISSDAWENIMMIQRSRFGSKMVQNKQVVRTIFKNVNKGLYVVFLNDQSPTYGDDVYWTKFFNKETMFFAAPEKIAKKFDLPVYFLDMWREKYGKYKIKAELISDNPKKTAENEITERYVRKLEQAIKRHPEAWLWSHKRWKRNKEDYLKVRAKEKSKKK
ncbi:MAG: lysophospholipid acyltransferase family protein [Bacteroidota bacterium]|nr:lysophospholipid acyltransferase family protein [Bacteroidota bacterium]